VNTKSRTASPQSEGLSLFLPELNQESSPPAAGRVVHCKKERHDVYIGRPSKWANPFVIGVDGTREEVIEKYRDWVRRQPHLMAALPELKGKVLGCWCHPQGCHGDVLIELLERAASDATSLLNRVGARLGCNRSVLSSELAIQNVIEEELGQLGISYDREFRLSPQDRPDFFVGSFGLAIEVKKGAAAVPELRQIARYLEHDCIRECAIVALSFSPEFPAELLGKPIRKFPIWKFMI